RSSLQPLDKAVQLVSGLVERIRYLEAKLEEEVRRLYPIADVDVRVLESTLKDPQVAELQEEPEPDETDAEDTDSPFSRTSLVEDLLSYTLGCLFGRWDIRLATGQRPLPELDRKSTRLNSSHVKISYAVFCLKK